MTPLLALIWKELLTVLRDRKVRMALLLPPLIQLVIFTFAATLEVKQVGVGVLNQDGGDMGFSLVQQFLGSETFRSKITHLRSMEEASSFLDHQKGVMVLAIDSQFSRNLHLGKPATLQLLLDGRKSNTAQVLASYTQQIVENFQAELARTMGLDVPQVALVPRTWFNPNTLYHWYNIPCLVCLLSMLTCLVVTTQSVALEREMGTFDQLLVAPLSVAEILIGKMLPGIIVGLFEGLLMLAIGTWILAVPFTGSFLLYAFSLLLFVTAISGIGLFISSLCHTQQQAMLGTFVFMSPSVILSGFATPVENMPTWLHPFSSLMPLKYMLIVSKGICLKAMPLPIVWSQLWPMSLIALCTVVGAALFFRKTVR